MRHIAAALDLIRAPCPFMQRRERKKGLSLRSATLAFRLWFNLASAARFIQTTEASSRDKERPR